MVTEGIIPFAQKTYLISANQSTTFRVEDGSDAPMIANIISSYVIWQSSSDSMPSPTSAPQSLNPPQNPTTALSFTPFIVSPKNQTTYSTNQVPLIYTIGTDVLWSYYSLDIGNNSALRNFNGNITLTDLSEGQHELMVAVTTKSSYFYDQPTQIIQTILFFVNTTNPSSTLISTPTTEPFPVPTQIPEFPATLAITLLAMIALVVVVVFRRQHKSSGRL